MSRVGALKWFFMTETFLQFIVTFIFLVIESDQLMLAKTDTVNRTSDGKASL